MPTDTVEIADLPAAWAELLPYEPELGERLLHRWSEPHRRYHTPAHLAHMLTMINSLAEPGQELAGIRLAAWYHDAIYRIGATDNEEASAALAYEELTGLVERPAEVARLIMVTADHRPPLGDAAAALLCDADLAILAGAPEAYDDYVARVRAEYATVDDAAFTAGRLRVLTALREQDLFHTRTGRELLPAARANLDREISDLQAAAAAGQ
ncbi:HD domain-containing protein [Propionibacteriaceae bacterium Y1700]|uniref:HD domain-containing protein n=1 Tax=Microlunatus sp. Y1700 TaxID=3418487 RepID=UPI003DA78D26